jgi:hypothetical protein
MTTNKGQDAVTAAFSAALASGTSATVLEPAIQEHFPSLQVFRENDDLVLVEGESRRLLVRRVGADRFITGDVAAASGSTNLLDLGGEAERDLNGLIHEIAGFVAV